MPYANNIRIALNSVIQRASEDVPGLINLEIWQELRDIVFTLQIDSLEKDELFNFLVRLEPLFVRRDCQDKGLMIHMFYLVREERVQYYPVITKYFMENRFDGIKRTLDERARLRSSKYDDFKKIFSMPYKEATVFYVTGDSVTYTAIAGDIRLLKLLLKFGATVIQPSEENSHWWYCEMVVQELFPDVSASDIEASLSSNFSQTSKRRLYFVLLCLEVLIHLKFPPPGTYDYIASLRDLFKAIPEPSVTTTEICNCLEKLLRDLQKDEEIQTVANEFGNFFPESLQLPGPQSLMHLCRFQVRENLRKDFPLRLPQVVESLLLPRELKDYILLDIV